MRVGHPTSPQTLRTTTTTTIPPSSGSAPVGSTVALKNLESLSFSSPVVGHAVFFSGQLFANVAGIASTSDGGASWRLQTALDTFAPYNGIPSLRFVTDRDGWALASTSTGHATGHNLFRTTDGGSTWTRVVTLSDVTEVMPLATSIWAVTGGELNSLKGSGAVLWTSPDNGNSWHQVTTPLPSSAYGPTGAGSLWRTGPTTAYTTDNGRLVRTRDSGASWTTLTAPGTPDCPGEPDADEHFAAGSATALWVICGGQPAVGNEAKTVYRSSDGGVHWRVTASASFLPGTTSIGQISAGGYMFDGNFTAVSDTTAYLALGRLGLLQTTDGGKVWSKAIPLYADSTLLSTINATTSYAVLAPAADATLWRTIDGTHWAQLQ